LRTIRDIIKKAAPGARETIGYGMPTFNLNGNLVYLAVYKNHIGFNPTPSGISAFEEEFSEHKHAKGSVQFPLDESVPYDLIRRIVEFRVKEIS
jgi:uncharacterized protein YdhG (YjbR/CyaY superfamily)